MDGGTTNPAGRQARASNRPKKKLPCGKRKKKTPVKQQRAVVRRPADPDDEQLQVEVWDWYCRTRSRRQTAEALKIPEQVVADILRQDTTRLMSMIDAYAESMIAKWEARESESLDVCAGWLELARGMLLEIKTAAVEGRMTQIRDVEGNPLPVLDAMQFLAVSSVLDKAQGLAIAARQRSEHYRTGGGSPNGEGGLGENGSVFGRINTLQMSDVQIIALIREAGLGLPPMLERKAKLIESDAKKKT